MTALQTARALAVSRVRGHLDAALTQLADAEQLLAQDDLDDVLLGEVRRARALLAVEAPTRSNVLAIAGRR